MIASPAVLKMSLPSRNHCSSPIESGFSLQPWPEEILRNRMFLLSVTVSSSLLMLEIFSETVFELKKMAITTWKFRERSLSKYFLPQRVFASDDFRSRVWHP